MLFFIAVRVAGIFEGQCGPTVKLFVPRSSNLSIGENYTDTLVTCQREGGQIIRQRFNVSCLRSFITALANRFSLPSPFPVWTDECNEHGCRTSNNRLLERRHGLYPICAAYSKSRPLQFYSVLSYWQIE